MVGFEVGFVVVLGFVVVGSLLVVVEEPPSTDVGGTEGSSISVAVVVSLVVGLQHEFVHVYTYSVVGEQATTKGKVIANFNKFNFFMTFSLFF